jgi:ZIP family zinc transporter
MTQGTAALLGAIAGFTIFLGLPLARLRGLRRGVQGFLNAIATGILLFLLWDILAHASEPVESALAGARHGDPAFWGMAAMFAGGVAAGLMGLLAVNRWLLSRLPGTAVGAPRTLSLMIATGLGLHNLSEGLAIGQSAASGAIAFAGLLVIGFALHNITEGFGVAAPLALEEQPPSWGFLLVAGLIGGGPTLIGTVVGYGVSTPHVYVLFLTLAAGALIYVIGEMFAVGRKLNTPIVFGWGVLAGFLLAYATDLFLTFTGA